MFLKNCWYMTGWSHDFEIGKITKKPLIGMDLVFYRKPDGTLVAMDDKCCHRLAPLSEGQIEGDDIRCMYHGLKFGADGKCNEIPQAPDKPISKKICIKTYKVVEKYGSAWLWPGDANLADEATIPEFIDNSHEWEMIPDRKFMNTNYMYLNDNLLDLSHVAFVHRNSFGKGDEESNAAFAKSTSKTTKLANGVRVERKIKNAPAAGYVQELLGVKYIDFYTWYDFIVPGLFILNIRTYPLGYIDKYGDKLLEQETLFSEFSCQATTPIDEDNICYYFALGPDKRFPQFKQLFNDLGHVAFGEDTQMLEAQYRVIKKNPNDKLMNLAMDESVVNFRALMDKMLKAEAAQSYNA